MKDDLQKGLKEIRDSRWEEFDNTAQDSKMLQLLLIIMKKRQDDEFPLAVNIKNPGSNFDSIIFELISKAQSTPDNYYRLMLSFPEYVKLWEEWQEAPDEQDFFKKYGVE